MKSSFTPAQIEQLNQLRARLSASHKVRLRDMLPNLFSYNEELSQQFSAETDVLFSSREVLYAHPNQFEKLLEGVASPSTLTGWASLVADLDDTYGEMSYFDGSNTPKVFRTKVPLEVVRKMVDLGVISAVRNSEFTFLSLDAAFYAMYLLSNDFKEEVDRVVGIRTASDLDVPEVVPVSTVSDPDLDRISAISAGPKNSMPDLSSIIQSAQSTVNKPTVAKPVSKMPDLEEILVASSDLDNQIREAQAKLAELVRARNLERSLADVKILRSALRLESGSNAPKVRGTLTIETATGQQLVLEVSGAV